MADFANEYTDWRSGWLRATRAAWRETCTAEPLTQDQVTFAWAQTVLDRAYTSLAFALFQIPKFVVTNTAACKADKTSTTMGLTTWACTRTQRVITDPDAFVHSDTFDAKPSRAERENMLKLASRIDNDWIVAPIVALFLRLAMESRTSPLEPVAPDATADAQALAAFETEVDLIGAEEQMQCMADNGGGHVGLVEIDTPQLPLLQFAGPDGNPAFMSMTRHDRMNALRVGSRMMDPVHCRDMTGKRRVGLLDVELTMFLVWHWFGRQQVQEGFEEAVAAYAHEFAAAVKQVATDTRNLDDLVAGIESAATNSAGGSK